MKGTSKWYLWSSGIYFLCTREPLFTVERDSLFVLCEPFRDYSSASVKLITLNHHLLPLQVLERLLPGNINDKQTCILNSKDICCIKNHVRNNYRRSALSYLNQADVIDVNLVQKSDTSGHNAKNKDQDQDSIGKSRISTPLGTFLHSFT